MRRHACALAVTCDLIDSRLMVAVSGTVALENLIVRVGGPGRLGEDMRKLFLVALAGAMSMGVPAEAGKRDWYIGVEGGAEFDGGATGDSAGWAGLVTLGAGLTEHLSLEGEFGYRSTSSDGYFGLSAAIDQFSFIANLVYEVPLSKEASFAIGVGLGGDQVYLDYYYGRATHSEMEVVGQLKLGLSIALSESTELVGNYRYTESITSSPVDNSTLTVGLRFEL